MAKKIETLLASDIDNTLTGDPAALKQLKTSIDALRGQQKLYLFLTTGRTLDEVLQGFENEDIPAADAIISLVGTEIYTPPFQADMQPLRAWDEHLRSQFSRRQAVDFIDDIEGAEIQPAHYNTPLKVSYYLEKAPNPEQAAQQVMQRVAKAGNGYRVVWSSGRDLDILPADAGKGNAIRFLIDHLELEPQQVITAGDSGNDRSMLLEFERGIVVGNAQPELQHLKNESHPNDLYFATAHYAAGVAEGLAYFEVLSEETP